MDPGCCVGVFVSECAFDCSEADRQTDGSEGFGEIEKKKRNAETHPNIP